MVGRRVLRDGAEAEDLVQEVFLYVFRKCDLYDSSKGPARSWLIQIAYTQAFLRRRKLKSQGFYASEIVAASLASDSGERLPADYERTGEGLFGRRGWRKIMESLSVEQRETLILHFFEGYTFDEIARKLGQSYANIRNHHYRGLNKIRKHLAEVESQNR